MNEQMNKRTKQKKKVHQNVNQKQTFDFEFGVPGVPVPGIFESPIPPWLPLPFVMGVLNVVTDDCI